MRRQGAEHAMEADAHAARLRNILAVVAVAGIPTSVVDHADRALRFATDALHAVRAFCQRNHLDLQIRVGLHYGPVVAGVIGESKFAYDDFVRALTETTRPFIDRGMIDVKGKGAMRTWIVGE